MTVLMIIECTHSVASISTDSESVLYKSLDTDNECISLNTYD